MVTCWERADLLALVGDVYCIFVTFSCGILGQVWYLKLIVSFPDLCLNSYFSNAHPGLHCLSIYMLSIVSQKWVKIKVNTLHGL